MPLELFSRLLLNAAACWLLLSVGSFLFGCRIPGADERELAAALQRYESRGAQDAERYAPAPTTRPAPAEAKPAPEPPQSLRDYLARALQANPDILAAAERVRAALARVPQVTALPDPVVSTKTWAEPVRTAEGDNYFIFGVRMRFPVPEKLDRAGRIALQEARVALADLEYTRLRVIADVKNTYYRLYIIDKTIEIDLANQELLRGLIDAARAQVAAGRRSQDDVLRTQVELFNLERRLIELRQQRTTQAALLNRLLDREPTTPVPPLPDLSPRRLQADLDALLRDAERANPELRRARERIERERQALALAKLAYWPDFTLGLEWMQIDPRGAFEPLPNPQTGIRPPAPQLSEDGSDNWAVVFSFNVPLWYQKIRGGIREARNRLLAAQHEYAATQNRTAFEVEDALARIQAQQELADLFEHTIIPQARQAFEVSRAAYTGGRGDFLIVIDNWRQWLEFTIQYHRALGELERSVADLEQALGRSLAESGDES